MSSIILYYIIHICIILYIIIYIILNIVFLREREILISRICLKLYKYTQYTYTLNLISTDFQEKFRREFAVRLPCLRSANDEQHPPRRHTEAISETENCRRNRAPPRIQQTPQTVATEVHQSSNKTHVRLLDLILNRKPGTVFESITNILFHIYILFLLLSFLS